MKSIRRLTRSTYHAFGYDLHRWPPLKVSLEDHLSGLLTHLAINCVIDVGAHWGEYATSLRATGYQGRIVSFEPANSTFERLDTFAAADRDWQTHHAALGRISETRLFNVPGDTFLASFLEPTDFALRRFPAAAIDHQEPIDVKRLDDMLETCVDGIAQPRIFLKLDTQGWDLEVLAGATTALEWIVGLQSEISVKAINDGMPDYLVALGAIRDLGFEVTGLYPVSRDDRSQIIELDAVFIRTNG